MTTDGITRRQTLTGAAALGVATPLLAACGSDDGGEAAEPPPAGEELGATSDVPVGGGKIFGDQKVVVTQPTEGDFKAFSAVCTHQSCVVARIADGTIDCTCHGSKFSAADGSVVNGPATSPLAPVSISVDGDTISTA
ncbi:Rieske (2Fe-2S) protein [Nocardioides sp. YIM 152315]|uniref:Rieske (2Fe-2S) protein n=1 Tax=Nocardioides sp. YIM 152315 TaxID=3031760 RepID=UPI0023DB16A4|nr:Rieske (2Fe-2S) protein [Nocardioides sp. YIM 152315]MDF1602673.1 Rieske (2Fe-2S) protein [Nocardioides sp. YIM 152315]